MTDNRKRHYDDLIECLEDAAFPLAVFYGQNRTERFGNSELAGLDMRILMTIIDELDRLIERLQMRRDKRDEND
jgi:hypothetical protein